MQKSNWFYLALAFLAGALLSYLLSQYQFLDIDSSVNVSDLLLATITAIIGLYIANTLQKKHNRNQNLYEYLMSTLNRLVSGFESLSSTLIMSNNIDLNEVIKTLKSTQKQIDSLKRTLLSHNIDNSCLDELEYYLEYLEDLLTNRAAITNNVINHSNVSNDVNKCLDEINSCFNKAFMSINKSC